MTPNPTFWLLGGARSSVLLDGEATGGRCGVTTHELPAGMEIPAHVQHEDDETLVVVDGALDLWHDGERRTLTAGEAVHLPRGTEHAFRVTGDAPARIVVFGAPARHERFFVLAGHPVDEHPEPPSLDLDRLAEAADATGMTILGPAPF